ncbi:MAG: bifunctional aspartate kinase/homoserine dehydrogenase I [Acidobacteria bacterium]|nr:MAG: bifunctional aspartate kinase/homoserine dehydrogenase I [Acidobacteriota bacterium]
MTMKVIKFGGSSLATPERLRGVVEIVARALGEGPVAVVISAFGDVTDRLLAGLEQARDGGDPSPLLRALAQRHRDAIAELAPAAEHASLVADLERRLAGLGALLDGVRVLGEASPRTRDRVLAQGELLAAPIVAAALRRRGIDASSCDARRLIVTAARHGGARADFAATRARVRRHFDRAPEVQVVTGFIAASASGETTTLGRGGSDTTAALLGAALDAEAVELWTDVDGVMSADPRLVAGAVPLAAISYEELMELSHFGAQVVHPPSVQPTRSHGIPLWIKNSFRPELPGTRVSRRLEPAVIRARGPVCGIASLRPIALLRLEGEGLVGVPGIAMRLFEALARREVNVILISQASSEHTLCFAVDPQDVARTREGVAAAFALELRSDLVRPLVVEEEMAVLAAVGEGMRQRPGIAARLFAALGSQGINVHAIAQGSSERNVSLVVRGADEVRAVNAVHNAFFVAGRRTADVALAGTGAVGAQLLAQLARQRSKLLAERLLELRLVGVANSRRQLLDGAGLDPGSAASRLVEEGDAGGFEGLVEHLAGGRHSLRIFVDCTASEAVAGCYHRLRDAGVTVVTANKRRLSGPLAAYRRLLRSGPGRLYYETTVGAGLPVIRTLEDLLATGDRVHRIEGMLSGTLGFLCHRLAGGEALSAALAEADRRGYTEPDPRDDLGGLDVARKLLILARLAGRELELEDLELEPFLPARPWAGYAVAELWQRLPEADAEYAARVAASAGRGERLTYLARLEAGGRARVGWASVAADHPCAGLTGGENLVAFYTDRYGEEPLVVRGPGAGPERTAAGVFADLLRAVAEGEGGP